MDTSVLFRHSELRRMRRGLSVHVYVEVLCSCEVPEVTVLPACLTVYRAMHRDVGANWCMDAFELEWLSVRASGRRQLRRAVTTQVCMHGARCCHVPRALVSQCHCDKTLNVFDSRVSYLQLK